MLYLRKLYPNLLNLPLFDYAFATGAALRMVIPLSSHFPINDGGLFYTMIEDLKKANFILPFETSYNQSGIPFVYPPLALYITGFISKAFQIDTITLLKILPAIFSTATIPVFYLICKKLLDKHAAIFAVFAFAIIPRSFEWLIMGGGITRSLGFIFSLLAIYSYLVFIEKFNKQPKLKDLRFSRNSSKNLFTSLLLPIKLTIQDVNKKPFIFTVISISLVFLSHPEWSMFTVISIITLTLFQRKKYPLTGAVGLMFMLSLILISPWLYVLIERHGISFWLSAFESGKYFWNPPYVLYLISLKFTDEPLFGIFSALALYGIFISLINKKFLVPAWLFLALFLIPRGSGNPAIVPVSLLAGFGARNLNLLKSGHNKKIYFKLFTATVASVSTLAFLAIFALGEYSLSSLSKEEVETMSWISRNTPANAQFLVLSQGSSTWGTDKVVEWFPSLTLRKSLTTPQGHEWLPKDFGRRLELLKRLEECAYKDITCIESLSRETNFDYSHIYIDENTDSIGAYAVLKESLLNSRNYIPIYERQGVYVFEQKQN